MNCFENECDDGEQLCIPIASSSVTFLQTPEHFYQQILERISSSKKRIILAALYLGTSKKEEEIVKRLEAAQNANNNLTIAVLLDYFRGTRTDSNGNSSVTMLNRLRRTPGSSAKLSFFYTPEMRGLKCLLPERVNEIIGLQHMKFFIFDDAILISGANLSDQYFVNRQDRYILIEDSPLLADFFESVSDIISKHSLHIDSQGELKFGGDSSIHPQTAQHHEIENSIKTDVNKLYNDCRTRILQMQTNRHLQQMPNDGGQPQHETYVIPFLQMGMFKIDQEIQFFGKLFNKQRDDLEVTLMTAYFNLYDAYSDLIASKCPFPLTIVFGSPEANGFYGASGLSGQIPALYAQNILDFMGKLSQSSCEKVEFKEWNRPGWTFHAKGIWIDSHSSKKMATLIGSSNYGYRSAHRDLEAQILLVTENEALKSRIIEEKNSLLEFCTKQDINMFLRRDHLIPTWVKYFSRFFKNFF